jgi:hypothetical protein
MHMCALYACRAHPFVPVVVLDQVCEVHFVEGRVDHLLPCGCPSREPVEGRVGGRKHCGWGAACVWSERGEPCRVCVCVCVCVCVHALVATSTWVYGCWTGLETSYPSLCCPSLREPMASHGNQGQTPCRFRRAPAPPKLLPNNPQSNIHRYLLEQAGIADRVAGTYDPTSPRATNSSPPCMATAWL